MILYFFIFIIFILSIDLIFMIILATGIGLYFTTFTQILSCGYGFYILRQYDLNTIFYIDTTLKKKEIIVNELWEEFFIIISALFLIVPGFFTDLIGIIYLTPYFRSDINRILFR
jgi:UPF0716 protein FxsA